MPFATIRVSVLFGLVWLGAGAAATAHHSPSMFDQQQKKSVSGTVREFQWSNPHCYVQLLVRNAKGVEEEWSFEMGAPTYLYGRGWRPSTLKAGDVIHISYAPLRRGGNGGMLLQATRSDGKPLGKKP